MTRDPACIFCRIVAGEIPALKLHEDARSLAFMDINPANPGHCLAIPRAHAADVYAIDPEDLAATAATAQRLARAVREVLAPDGLNLVQANGPGAAQSVQHFHFHILPRRRGDGLALNWVPSPGVRAELERIAGLVRARLG